MNVDYERPDTSDPFLEEVSSCLARVRDHIYRSNLGGTLVRAGCEILGLSADGGIESPAAVEPVLRKVSLEAADPGR